MTKVKENNIRWKDGQTLCVGHKIIFTLRFYTAKTRFSEFKTQRQQDTTVCICLFVRPATSQTACHGLNTGEFWYSKSNNFWFV